MTVRYHIVMRTDDMHTARGTRADLIAELKRLHEGFQHLGSERLVRAAADGVYDLETGCGSTTVGTRLYVVTDD